MSDTKDKMKTDTNAFIATTNTTTSLAPSPAAGSIVHYYSFWPRNRDNHKIKITRNLVTENLLVYGLKYNALEFIAYQVSKLDASGYRPYYAPYFFFIGMLTGTYGMWKGVESVMSPFKTSGYKQTINALLSATVMAQYLLGVAVYSDLLLNPVDGQENVSDGKILEVAAAPFAFAFIGYLAWLKLEKRLLEYCNSDGRSIKYKCGDGETAREIARKIGLGLVKGMHFLWRWVMFTSILNTPIKLYNPKTPTHLADADKEFKVAQLVPVVAGLGIAGAEHCVKKKGRQIIAVGSDILTAGCVGAETYYAIQETPPPFWLLILRAVSLFALVAFGLYFTCKKTKKIYKETLYKNHPEDNTYKELSEKELMDDGLQDQCSPASLARLSTKELQERGEVEKVKTGATRHYSAGSPPGLYGGKGPVDPQDLGVPYSILPNSNVGDKIVESVSKQQNSRILLLDVQNAVLDAKIRGMEYALSSTKKPSSAPSTPQFNQTIVYNQMRNPLLQHVDNHDFTSPNLSSSSSHSPVTKKSSCCIL